MEGAGSTEMPEVSDQRARTRWPRGWLGSKVLSGVSGNEPIQRAWERCALHPQEWLQGVPDLTPLIERVVMPSDIKFEHTVVDPNAVRYVRDIEIDPDEKLPKYGTRQQIEAMYAPSSFRVAARYRRAGGGIKIEPAWRENPPQNVYGRRFPGYSTFQIKVIQAGKHVGGLLAEEADLTHCPGDLEALSEQVGTPLKPLVVQKSFLPEDLRGTGLGAKIYEMALREAAKKGYALAPNDCWHGGPGSGMTSPDAQRVWNRWRGMHPHSGEVFWGGSVRAPA